MQMARCKTAFLFAVIGILVLPRGSTQHKLKAEYKPLDPDYQYPTSYKDHVYTNLSESARGIFFAVNIHPSCVAKKGQCIPRGHCIQKKMLYISRACYTMDLVCCYTDHVKTPTVEYVTSLPPAITKPQSSDAPPA